MATNIVDTAGVTDGYNTVWTDYNVESAPGSLPGENPYRTTGPKDLEYSPGLMGTSSLEDLYTWTFNFKPEMEKIQSDPFRAILQAQEVDMSERLKAVLLEANRQVLPPETTELLVAIIEEGEWDELLARIVVSFIREHPFIVDIWREGED